MKRFDISAWVRSVDDADIIAYSLECGWPQQWYGKPQAEVKAAGYSCLDEWCVDDEVNPLRKEFVDEVAKAYCQHKYQNLVHMLYSTWTSPKWQEKVEVAKLPGCGAQALGFNELACNCAYLRCGECFLTDAQLLGEIQTRISELKQREPTSIAGGCLGEQD